MKNKLIYIGKTKDIYAAADSDLIIMLYKDEAIAFNGIKRATIANKGILNNKISALLFETVAKAGIPTHFIKRLTERKQLCHKVKMIALDVVVRNYAAENLYKRLPFREGEKLKRPIFELFYKDDKTNDLLINNDHVLALELLSEKQLSTIYEYSIKINDVLYRVMTSIDINLVDVKLEFGINNDNEIILSDEISPDTCRLWCKRTGERLDSDRFCYDLGQVIEAYEKIYQRLVKSEWVKK
ncbi:MAG: phosphoribosylaminoimidazolesuccinocarboxamide synthase [Bacilli bacterium]|nr:phosphoribosylaminoimidazolesuccinocarboxamide synthase [Bacilli bacterium]MDD4076715.1 phosphoribosylaminoimidazolesuccinocarboxamide synthase [Bacilli bacterium]MDD4387694.1 phosphoribosylaminoimidazolesuccinocarboxamide synthase [Bacilli bacterium]